MRRYFLIGGFVAALVVLVGVGFLAWIGTGRGLVPVQPSTPAGRNIRDIYVFVGAFASAIFLVVMVPLALFVIRFRNRDGDRSVEGPQIRGNASLELAWTIGPVLILAALVAFAFLKLPDLINPSASAANQLEVRVEGRQFYWRFVYPNGVVAIDRIRVPVDREVRLTMAAPDSDVIHSFWVPAIGGKLDAIPGVENQMAFRVTRAGEYQGKCAELCGLQHSAMLFTLEALPEARFRSWLSNEARAQQTGDSDLGQQIFADVCSKCHFAAPEYAPNIAGNPLLGQPDTIERIVRNGRGRMPAVGAGWSEREVDALTSYLKTIAPQGGSSGG